MIQENNRLNLIQSFSILFAILYFGIKAETYFSYYSKISLFIVLILFGFAFLNTFYKFITKKYSKSKPNEIINDLIPISAIINYFILSYAAGTILLITRFVVINFIK